MTKIDIISGFLGAGKTTLIKKIIKEALPNEKLVLIENEFGEIGIDGGFLKDAGIEVKEMNSGCICCSLVGDFSEALKKVLVEYHPDRILIEPSGVGKLSDVMSAIKGVQKEADIQLNSYTTLVDAQKCTMYMKNFGEFFNNQVEYAHTIILSRTQNLTQEKLEHVVHELKHHNKHATCITTSWDKIDGKEILSAMEEANGLEKELLAESDVCPICAHSHEDHHHKEHTHHHDEHCSCTHEHHDHHHADEVFTSWGSETPRKYNKTDLDNILQELANTTTYGTILRAKGMLEGEHDEWYYFDLVPDEYEIRTGLPTYTGRFCVIGSDLQEDALSQLFKVA
ncbi:MAG: GTP-binding protein [Longicatena sp.]